MFCDRVARLWRANLDEHRTQGFALLHPGLYRFVAFGDQICKTQSKRFGFHFILFQIGRPKHPVANGDELRFTFALLTFGERLLNLKVPRVSLCFTLGFTGMSPLATE